MDDWVCNLDDLSYSDGALNDVGSIVYFDGRCAHETEAYTGERYSLVFYLSSSAEYMSTETSDILEALGAVFPPRVVPS